MPSTSPGRGRRVVTETDTHTPGCLRRTSATTVPLPTPEGPESTVRRAGEAGCTRRPRPGSSIRSDHPAPGRGSADLLAAELRFERLALVGPQTADPPGRGDLQSLHDLRSPRLADSRQGFQDRGDPHLADHLVGVAPLQDVTHGGALALQLLAQFRPRLAGGGRLLERSRTLFRGKLRQGHGPPNHLVRRLYRVQRSSGHP